MGKKSELTARQREAILQLGTRGSNGSFDPRTLSELFSLELIEVRPIDRRVVLTARGQHVYEELLEREEG